MAGPAIHTYRAAEPGLFVNSYLVEGESGVVVVDTNLLASDIEALCARATALKKPLRAILMTHAHPDHFNGVLSLVREREVPAARVPAAIRRRLAKQHADSAQASSSNCQLSVPPPNAQGVYLDVPHWEGGRPRLAAAKSSVTSVPLAASVASGAYPTGGYRR